jgi:hypothetical protein
LKKLWFIAMEAIPNYTILNLFVISEEVYCSWVETISLSICVYTVALWTYPANEQAAVVYSGPELEPGQVYTFRAQHVDFPNTIFESRQFQVVSAAERQAIAAELVTVSAAVAADGGSLADVAIARADYFWAQGFEADAWREIAVAQQLSLDAAEAVAFAYTQLCGILAAALMFLAEHFDRTKTLKLHTIGKTSPMPMPGEPTPTPGEAISWRSAPRAGWDLPVSGCRASLHLLHLLGGQLHQGGHLCQGHVLGQQSPRGLQHLGLSLGLGLLRLFLGPFLGLGLFCPFGIGPQPTALAIAPAQPMARNALKAA